MGLISTLKYFPAIFTILITRKMENLTHSFLDMVGKSQTGRNTGLKRWVVCPKVCFLAIFTIFLMEKFVHAYLAGQEKITGGEKPSLPKKWVLCPKRLFSYFHCLPYFRT